MTTTLTATGITFNDATSQTTTGVEIPAGTLMLFQQTSAPTGWTKQTTHNDKALRVVSGTADSGGSVAFSTAFASGRSADATTLSTAQMPSHSHTLRWFNAGTGSDGGSSYPILSNLRQSYSNNSAPANDSSGSGNSHTHTLPSFAVQYVDLIIASKN